MPDILCRHMEIIKEKGTMMAEFIKGMDISTLLEQEACGARYFDNGEEGDMLEILKRYGVNSVRLRLWNNPYDEDGNPYGAGTNDLEKTIIMAKRAKKLGRDFCLITIIVIFGRIRESRQYLKNGKAIQKKNLRRRYLITQKRHWKYLLRKMFRRQ